MAICPIHRTASELCLVGTVVNVVWREGFHSWQPLVVCFMVDPSCNMHTCHTHFQHRNSRTALLVSFLPFIFWSKWLAQLWFRCMKHTWFIASHLCTHTPFWVVVCGLTQFKDCMPALEVFCNAVAFIFQLVGVFIFCFLFVCLFLHFQLWKLFSLYNLDCWASVWGFYFLKWKQEKGRRKSLSASEIWE